MVAGGMTHGMGSLPLTAANVPVCVVHGGAIVASPWIIAGVISVGGATVAPMPRADIGIPKVGDSALESCIGWVFSETPLDLSSVVPFCDCAAFAASRAALRSRLKRLRSRDKRLSCSDTRSYSHLRCNRVHV